MSISQRNCASMNAIRQCELCVGVQIQVSVWKIRHERILLAIDLAAEMRVETMIRTDHAEAAYFALAFLCGQNAHRINERIRETIRFRRKRRHQRPGSGHRQARHHQGIHKSIASRVSGLARRIGVRDDVVMTGGVAQNGGIVHALEEQLGHPILTSPLTQYNGALGAALYAYEKAVRNAKMAK